MGGGHAPRSRKAYGALKRVLGHEVIRTALISTAITGAWGYYFSLKLERAKTEFAREQQRNLINLQNQNAEHTRRLDALNSLATSLAGLDNELRCVSVIASTPTEPIDGQMMRTGLAVRGVMVAAGSPHLRGITAASEATSIVGTVSKAVSDAQNRKLSSRVRRDLALVLAALYRDSVKANIEAAMTHITQHREKLLTIS